MAMSILHGNRPHFSRAARSAPAGVAVLAIMLLSAWPQTAAAQVGRGRDATRAVASITAKRAAVHVRFLADDALLGRDTPSPGLDTAAEYIARTFRAAGLEPVRGSYFHEYNIVRQDLDATSLSVGRPFTLKDDFVPFLFSAQDSVSGRVVFAGYGLVDERSGYDDYAGLDVRGAVVLVVEGVPGWMKSLGDRSSEKMRRAARRGATAIVIVGHPDSSRALRPFVSPWPSLASGVRGMRGWRLDLPEADTAIAAASIGADVVAALWGAASSDDRPVALEQFRAQVRSIDSARRPASLGLKASLALAVSLRREVRTVRNVVAMLPGRKLPDEYVVVGAHYDHIGHGVRRSNSGSADTIFNGADDNASGTAGLLLAAEACGALPRSARPLRSILFIAFSGEEHGLYGSRAWVANPSVPNRQAVAMINMDMIGRNHPDSVGLAGANRSTGLIPLLHEANRAERMKFSAELEAYFHRSDQAAFDEAGIPSLFLSTGMHPDYHMVSDEFAKVDTAKLARIARLCYRTAMLVANASTRPERRLDDVDEP